MNVLRSLIFSVALCGKFATFSILKKNKLFSQKNHSLFFKRKPNFLTFWEHLLIQSHSTAKLAIFSSFFRKKPTNFFKTTFFWTFCWFLLFQSHGSANMVPLAIFKENSHFFRKTHLVFFIKKPKISTFREISLNQLHSTASFRPLALSKILKIFFEKTVFFFKKNPIFEHFQNS